jgi:hypothetical protein
VIAESDLPALNLYAQCGANVEAGEPISATDNCDEEPLVLNPSDQILLVPNGCANRYDINRGWTGADCSGNPVHAHQLIHVNDQTAPTVNPTSCGQVCLWPVNHKYVVFDISTFVTGMDNCPGAVSTLFYNCSSTEPENGLGDGNTLRDCVYVPATHSLYVRAERRGISPLGRFYSVAVNLVDSCGNVGSAGRTIWVPHNQLQTLGKTCIKATVSDIPLA